MQRRTRPHTSVRFSPWLLMVRLPHTTSRTLLAISPRWALTYILSFVGIIASMAFDPMVDRELAALDAGARRTA